MVLNPILLIFLRFPPSFFIYTNVNIGIEVDIVGLLGTRNRLTLLITSLPSIDYEYLAKSNADDESNNTIITNLPLTKTLTRLKPLIYTTRGYTFEQTVTYKGSQLRK